MISLCAYVFFGGAGLMVGVLVGRVFDWWVWWLVVAEWGLVGQFVTHSAPELSQLAAVAFVAIGSRYVHQIVCLVAALNLHDARALWRARLRWQQVPQTSQQVSLPSSKASAICGFKLGFHADNPFFIACQWRRSSERRDTDGLRSRVPG